MEFPDWTYTQSLNAAFHEETCDQQLHYCGNIVPFITNRSNPEANLQRIPSMAAHFLNPGGLDQVFPVHSPPDPVTVQYDDNMSMMSSWHNNHDPVTQNHLFNIREEATWENPLFYIPGEATPENPEFSVSNFGGQSDLNVNYSLPEPPQFTNCMQSSKNGLSFATDTLEEYDCIPMISSDLEKLVKSMSHNGNHSMEASNNEFSDVICMENVVNKIHDLSGIMTNAAGNHTDDVLAKIMNPEIDFHHAIEDHHPDLEEPRWEKDTPLSRKNIPVPSSSQTADTMISPIKEIIYRAAALMPLNLDPEVVEKDQKPKRKNVRISSEPQTVAARRRRERISERLKVLQKLVPGGDKLDTASLLEEAANYLKFLKAQIKVLEDTGRRSDNSVTCMPTNLMFYPLPSYHSFPMGNNISL